MMGLFTILMVVCAFIYSFDQSVLSQAVIFLCIWLLSYVLPLVFNFSKLRVADFIKGAVYSIFLSPTYINIFTIFAISNIHDVSWGSRPSVTDKSAMAIEAEREQIYKDYRSKFLLIWVGINFAVGATITQLSRSGEAQSIEYVAIFLIVVLSLKICFGTMHLIATMCHRHQVKKHILNKPKNDIFKDIEEVNVLRSMF